MNEPSPAAMRRRGTRHAGIRPRCTRCGMHLRLCLCALLEPLAVRTRVVVLSSAHELAKTTGTARLVPLTLEHGEVRADGTPPGDLERPLLLFPGPGSRELRREDATGGPCTLVVPDGTWRRARRMVTRTPGLADLPRVHLPPGPPSRYRLRSHPDADCLATFEAVARALGLLEGADVQARLEHALAVMVERTLWSRGRLHASAVTGGIPAPLEREGATHRGASIRG